MKLQKKSPVNLTWDFFVFWIFVKWGGQVSIWREFLSICIPPDLFSSFCQEIGNFLKKKLYPQLFFSTPDFFSNFQEIWNFLKKHWYLQNFFQIFFSTPRFFSSNFFHEIWNFLNKKFYTPDFFFRPPDIFSIFVILIWNFLKKKLMPPDFFFRPPDIFSNFCYIVCWTLSGGVLLCQYLRNG